MATHSFRIALLCTLLTSVCTVVVAAHDHTSDDLHRGYKHLSAKAIVDKSIQALGGQSALESVKTVSSHALYVYQKITTHSMCCR